MIHRLSGIVVIGPAGGHRGYARVLLGRHAGEDELTLELLEDAIRLTRPDRHPPERHEAASRVTVALNALRPHTRFRGSRYFVVPPGRNAQPGIYRPIDSAFGRGAQPVFVFVRQAGYARRLDFAGVVERRAQKEFPCAFTQRLELALATAK